MNILTPSGYVNINNLNIGDEIIAYDINTGDIIINQLKGKHNWTYDMFPAIPEEGYYNENGDWIVTQEGQTSEQVFQNTHGDWTFYKINDTWTLYKDQSVWANMNITNASLLQIGDIIYNDQDEDVIITSIEEVTALDWWRLDISGDSSYIADNLSLHNASRYWVGGGSSSNWNATANTNWSATSGGANNASIPTSADDVFFDSAGNSSSTISATITILSLTIDSGYTSTMTHNATLTIAGNVTLGANYTIAGTAQLTISAASTITSNGKTWPNNVSVTGTNTKTLVGDFTINGTLSIDGAMTLNSTTSEILFVNNGFAGVQSTVGTTTIYLQGGSWGGNASIQNNLTLNGNITITGTKSYRTGILKYLSGTIITTGSTISCSGTTTFDTFGMSFNNVDLLIGTFTLNSKLVCNTIIFGFSNTIFTGSFGFDTNNVVLNGSNSSRTLGTGITYTINNSITGTVVNNTFTSSSATIRANLVLGYNATCSILANFTRIDASGGRTINTWNGTVTDCINVRNYSDLLTVAKSFV
jgi:hypothetical protein